MINAFYCGKYKDKRADSTKESAHFFIWIFMFYRTIINFNFALYAVLLIIDVARVISRLRSSLG